ncbi:uncharacterized protein LOC114306204 [Camellia sinensis]|uniref:uncharacterized protein LOC114306204 n=2 Tax=Camellia sinensis TaxID=4442 RepID=UPI0010367F87|nr:uncharacterized protein LOC114306204 [Camellia sinensis]
MESQSLKLRNILEFHNLPISPTHRFSLLVHPCELTSLPSLFSSSSNPSHTRILHQFSRIQTAPCCKEPVHFPIDSVETSSSHAFQSASKVEDDDTNSMPSDIGLIQRAAWIGLTTIMSKILRLIREIIVASVFGIGSVATAFKCKWSHPYYYGHHSKVVHSISAKSTSLLTWGLLSRPTFQPFKVLFFVLM